jgi:hypothetical protein
VPGPFRSTASIICFSVSTSITSENGLRISRVFERICQTIPRARTKPLKMREVAGLECPGRTVRPYLDLPTLPHAW